MRTTGRGRRLLEKVRQAEGALRETQDALRLTQDAHRKTQDALYHTQSVLREQQISSGLIDRVTDNSVERDRELPSILLLAPPKTAGSYIMHTLLYGLRMHRRWISTGYFPLDLFRLDSLDSFWRDRGCIAFHHTDASEINLCLLKQTGSKVLLNVRDVRQCMISLVFYTLAQFPRPVRILHPSEPPNDFPGWSRERQIDWAIDVHLPGYVDWLSGWLAAVDRGDVRALVTRYEDLLRDEAAFFDGILEYCGIPKEKFSHPRLQLDKRVNFRKGEPDEWRRLFTPIQKARALAIIPSSLAARFGWQE
jgi:hypothetical protein